MRLQPLDADEEPLEARPRGEKLHRPLAIHVATKDALEGDHSFMNLWDLYAESGQTLQGSFSAAAAVDRIIFKN